MRRHRRTLLAAGVLGLAALMARRAYALDPASITAGGSLGQHDAHITCGPDVRVRHANGGLHYEHLFQSEGGKPGTGATLDVRAGLGTTTITKVVSENPDDAQKVAALERNEGGRGHLLGTTQITFGYDWRTFALRGGIGYFGFAGVENNSAFKARYLPLPALDMRIGRKVGFGGELGFGAPPVVGLTRWFSFYGIATYRFQEGGDVGIGGIAIIGGDLDNRNGILFRGGVPIGSRVRIGAFGLVDADDKSKFNGFNWTAGGGVTVLLDEPD